MIRDRRRLRRRGAIAVLLLPLMLAGCSGHGSTPTGSPEASETPTASEPTTSPAEEHTATVPVLRNGQITSAERFFGEEDRGYDWRAFDPVSETGLLVIHRRGYGPMKGFAVLGRTGPVARLTCESALPCSSTKGPLSDIATLGPGPDEVTVAPGDRTAKVIGYDGTLRRTIDLSATVSGGGYVQGLRWSPDGNRLAVLTEQGAPRNSEVAWKVSRVWLVDREGGHAQRAYSLVAVGKPAGTFDTSEFDGEGSFWVPGWSWSWSPDGQALLLDVLDPRLNARVVVLRLQRDGAVDRVIAQTLYRSNRQFDSSGNVAWSPDGTRIAVRTGQHGHGAAPFRVTEISAEDGSVIAQHPHNSGWLIWPAKDG